MPTSEPTAPYRGLRLKTIKQNPLSGGCFSTVGPNTRLSVISSSTTSKPKAITISSGPVFQASKRPTGLREASRSVTSIATLAHKRASAGQELSSQNWTPITPAKVVISAPPPRLKVQKDRRGTILPKVGSTPLFDPGPNQKYKDVYDTECNSPSWQSEAPSKALSPHTPPAKLPAKDPSPKPAP
jgi:hypothetical protein